MKLDEQLPQKLAEWRFEGERRSLTLDDPANGWALELVADCADAIGCRLWEATVRPTALRPEFDLKTKADRLASQITGLLEPLKLVELDNHRRTAQLRSEEPGRKGDESAYYELLLQGDGSASVRRFQAPRLGNRAQIPFTLTNDALSKLVGDLAN